KVVREHFSGAEITLLVRPWVAGLFTSAPFIDILWSEEKPSRLADWTRITKDIRRREFDVALLLPNSFESALMIFLGRVPQRIGYATDARRWMLTNAVVPYEGPKHQVQYYLELVKAFSKSVDVASIEIQATRDERDNARNLLNEEGIPRATRFLVLNPGAAYGS